MKANEATSLCIEVEGAAAGRAKTKLGDDTVRLHRGTCF